MCLFLNLVNNYHTLADKDPGHSPDSDSIETLWTTTQDCAALARWFDPRPHFLAAFYRLIMFLFKIFMNRPQICENFGPRIFLAIRYL